LKIKFQFTELFSNNACHPEQSLIAKDPLLKMGILRRYAPQNDNIIVFQFPKKVVDLVALFGYNVLA